MRGRRSHNVGMHYLSCLAVEADTAREAIGAAEAFLENYHETAYDWYVIGGRWSGVCGGEDYVCAGDNRGVFDDVVASSIRARDSHFNHIRQNLVGPDPKVAVRDNMVSQPLEGTEEHEEWVEKVWESYAENSRLFAKLLSESGVPGTGDYQMIGYYMRELADLISGHFDANSYFYDTVAGTNGAQELYERVSSDPKRQWIVAVDLHN